MCFSSLLKLAKNEELYVCVVEGVIFLALWILTEIGELHNFKLWNLLVSGERKDKIERESEGLCQGENITKTAETC